MIELKSDAIQQLDDAVQELIGPRFTHDEYGPVIKSSLYAAMCEKVGDGTRDYQEVKTQFRSTPAAWTAGVSWIDEVERKTKEWAGRGDTSLRLHSLTARSWTPAETPQVLDIAKRVRIWCSQARRLLDPPWRIEPRIPCPECQETHVERLDDLGETVKSWCLAFDPDGAHCEACGAWWGNKDVPALATAITTQEISRLTDMLGDLIKEAS